jgi:hypothetical protein
MGGPPASRKKRCNATEIEAPAKLGRPKQHKTRKTIREDQAVSVTPRRPAIPIPEIHVDIRAESRCTWTGGNARATWDSANITQVKEDFPGVDNVDAREGALF